MNIKAIAAIVGSLSFATLGAGCKTTASAEKPAATGEKGASGSCGAGTCSGADKSGASTTGEKGGSHSCGSGSCSGNK